MAEVVVNVKANTGQATNEVDDLNSSLNKTEQSAEALSDSLEKQEARIKTLGGAINLVGGSVELLAGSLAVSGALSEEQAAQFEAAAVGAIAFADGAKRVFEGYKELNEGLKAYGGFAKAAQLAQSKFNKAVLANPYVAVAAALAALTAGIVAYRVANDEAGKRQANVNKLNQRALEILGDQVTDLRVLQAIVNDVSVAEEKRETALKKLGEIIPQVKGLDMERKGVLDDINLAIANEIQLITQRAKVAAAEESLTEIYQEQLRLESEIERLQAGRLTNTEKVAYRTYLSIQNMVKKYKTELKDAQANEKFFTDFIVENTSPALEGLGKDLTTTTTKIENLPKEVEINIRPKIIVPGDGDQPPTLAEWFQMNVIDQIEGPELQPIIKPEFDTSGIMDYEITLLDRLYVMQGAIQDFYASELGKGLSQNLNAAEQLTDSLVQVVDDGSEEAFEKAKKYKIADVVTSSTKAAFDAFAAAQSYGPILGPILGAAQVAAIAVTANRAIQDIRSSTFNSGNVAGGGGTQASAAVAGFNPGGLGGSQQTLVTSIPPVETTPMRAYVVTGDVTDGQAAEAQLQSRRTFGGG